MNKGELVEAVAARLGDSKAQASRAVEAVVASIAEGLKRDEAVTIVGFGTFQVKERAARIGRNPRNNEPIEIPASQSG